MSFVTEFSNVPQQTYTNMNQYPSEITFLPHPLLGRDGCAVLTQGNTLVPSSPQTSQVQIGGVNYDGRRMRNKTNLRKTVDYNASVINWIHGRGLQRDHMDRRAIQPDPLYNTLMLPPSMITDKPVNCLCTRSIRMAMNKVKCPIFTVKWTPEGRRLITGASSGEFTLWNGLTFSFETILQAHDVAVRSMVWSHGDQWMVTADHEGYVKYWQSNMNNVKMYQIHKSAVRGLSFSPSDQKFASGSDDNTVRIWDFMRCQEEKILRGHGADIRCVDWHPDLGIVVSGSRDTQQPVKLWDVKSGNCIFTIHAHKHTVMDLKWNRNGNWLLTASRDHLLKLFDIRNFKEEVQLFRGHKKEATTIAWHPIHEHLFASGGSDGSIMYWLVGNEKELGGIENAHDTMVWSLDWHPLGHIIASGSNDHTTKFWTRNRPGDMMRDRYNLNTLPYGADDNDADVDVAHNGVPGLDIEAEISSTSSLFVIPGLDVAVPECDDGLEINGTFEPASITLLNQHQSRKKVFKKVLHGKAVPRDFERAWKEGRQPNSGVNQPLQFESGFIQNDNEISLMIGDVQEGSDVIFSMHGSPHINEMENSKDEFCEENRFSDEFRTSNNVDYTSQNDFLNYYQDHRVSRFPNSSRNKGGNNYRFSSGSHSKYPFFNRKRSHDEYDVIEAHAGRRSIEFLDESDRGDLGMNFSFKNRGRGNRSRGNVFPFR